VIHPAEVAGGKAVVVFRAVVASILIQNMAALELELAEVQASTVYTQNNQLFFVKEEKIKALNLI
jgi:hypothetical protein